MHIYKTAVALLLCAGAPAFAGSRWGADYFPNVPLVTHEGETVHFFDLIEDKVVAINFIYTSCPDTCPLETARMANVQRILGDRVGQDVFMYSITIDPEVDTPEVLAKYRERYRARPGWTFLTGADEDITLLRKKLGLYIEEIQDGSNNHNLNLIIGNQKTGQWMKRSPFENPYILATQLGTWLSGWKNPSQADLDYADAPDVRDISQGEYLFRTRCAACHTIGGGDEGLAPGLVGPDLLDVSKQRDREWLERWIAEPDVMLEELDPIAMGLYAKYDNVPMPNMRLAAADVREVIAFLDTETRRVKMQRARERRRASRRSAPAAAAPAVYSPASQPANGHGDHALASHDLGADAHADHQPSQGPAAGNTAGGDTAGGDAVAIMNAWIRQAHPEATVNAGYMTLVNVGPEDVTLVEVESPGFEKVELHEMAMADGLMKMRELTEVVVPAGGMLRFEPGGRHLMLKGPPRHLIDGQTVDLTLTFRFGRKQTVSVRVAER